MLKRIFNLKKNLGIISPRLPSVGISVQTHWKRKGWEQRERMGISRERRIERGKEEENEEK